VFVRVESEDGLVGWGEASHSGDDGATRLVVDSLARRAVGRSAFDVEALVQPAEAVRRGIVWAAAASGLEHALWDLIGKAAGQPAHRLIGGRLRDRIRLYANVNRHVVDRTPRAYARAAAAAVAEGFQAVKCAPFDGVGWQTLMVARRWRLGSNGCARSAAPSDRTWTCRSTVTGGSTCRARYGWPRSWCRKGCSGWRTRSPATI